ncbi:hypothetical protein ADICEAN_00220 [Cesiribacter andamanensis AMV16]|uniref:Uncharacterized protein n=2 Tax=Cesiribacter TaxID=1133570 RepID=M7N7N2_9BACT|nr:hypothetical protein ADICEAN_00220 [Cesiribacter andamanensis AMV16]
MLFSACAGSSSRTADRPAAPNLVPQQGDDEEYELIIIDPGFNSWFATNARPVNYYSPQHYKQWNDRYVRAWNELADRQGPRTGPDYPFQNHIQYDPSEDYGLELNYELYWYFRYVESIWGRRYNFPGPGGGRRF